MAQTAQRKKNEKLFAPKLEQDAIFCSAFLSFSDMWLAAKSDSHELNLHSALKRFHASLWKKKRAFHVEW